MILNIIPFAVGKLPVRYLCVPLITKKISVQDCKPLIDKVRNKVNDRRNKALSYAGRLTKSVIYYINKLFKGFLWSQGSCRKVKQKFLIRIEKLVCVE